MEIHADDTSWRQTVVETNDRQPPPVHAARWILSSARAPRASFLVAHASGAAIRVTAANRWINSRVSRRCNSFDRPVRPQYLGATARSASLAGGGWIIASSPIRSAAPNASRHGGTRRVLTIDQPGREGKNIVHPRHDAESINDIAPAMSRRRIAAIASALLVPSGVPSPRKNRRRAFSVRFNQVERLRIALCPESPALCTACHNPRDAPRAITRHSAHARATNLKRASQAATVTRPTCVDCHMPARPDE